MRKYNLLFDGSILTNEFSKNDARSGIFFMTKNIFNELLKREDINLYLYCDLHKLEGLKEYLDKYKLNIEITNECEFNVLHKLKFNFRNQKAQCDRKTQRLQRSLYSVAYSLCSMILKIIEPFSFNKELKLKLKQIDYYFSPNTKVPSIIKKTKHIKSAVYLHDTIPLILEEYKHQYTPNSWFYELMHSLSREEIYFANSECTKKDFLKYSKNITKNQITISYLATAKHFKQIKDINQLTKIKDKYNIPQNKKYVFSLCTLDPRKNLIRAVKSFIKFVSKNNIENLVFVIGGGHWDAFISKLENEIENLGQYKDKIIKAGYIDDEDLPALYSNAEWLVYTSQYEGFGLPPLEAMSCGCPVITSNNSSLPEVVGDAGIKIDCDSDEQHIEAYEKYYFNEELRREFAQKGLERSKQFSWEKCVSTIIEKLKEKGAN